MPQRSSPPEHPGNTDDAHTWACMCHFSALLGAVWWIPTAALWLPIGHLLCPFAVWVVKRKHSPWIDLAGREALNFQLAMTAYGAAGALLFSGILTSLWLWGIVLTDLFWIIRGGILASRGILFRYPLVPWRLFKEPESVKRLRQEHPALF